VHKYNTMNFVKVVRQLARTRDEPIQHIVFKGGGVRIVGFRSVSGAAMHMLLRRTGKRCDYSINANKLVLDVYNDVPSAEKRQTLAEAEPSFVQTAVWASSAITSTTYSFGTLISSELLGELLDSANVVDVAVTAGAFRVDRVTPSQIIGGVSDVLRFKSNVHRIRPPPTSAKKVPRSRSHQKRNAINHLYATATTTTKQ
jgi:hypothetical protein